MDRLTNGGSMWPEQEIVLAWLAKRDWIKIEFEDRLALQKELTKLRQSLSQQAVRDEALDEAANELERAFAEADTLNLLHGAARVRALKREPNASYSELGRDDDAPRRDFEREQYERAEREPNAAALELPPQPPTTQGQR